MTNKTFRSVSCGRMDKLSHIGINMSVALHFESYKTRLRFARSSVYFDARPSFPKDPIA
jgi:hypothetical protein